MLVELFAGFALLLIFFYTTFKYKTQFWTRMGVKQPKVRYLYDVCIGRGVGKGIPKKKM